jgi:rSAM-associated Gly-rich repeat protein
MSRRTETRHVLSLLLSLGVGGASAALATAHAKAPVALGGSPADDAGTVAERLAAIRESGPTLAEIADAPSAAEGKVLLAQWVNFNAGGGGIGWRNGGWGNGGWHNAGWGNGGWHNGGWGNGGWHNWGNGGWGNGGWHNWGNGWHNFWHNW